MSEWRCGPHMRAYNIAAWDVNPGPQWQRSRVRYSISACLLSGNLPQMSQHSCSFIVQSFTYSDSVLPIVQPALKPTQPPGLLVMGPLSPRGLSSQEVKLTTNVNPVTRLITRDVLSAHSHTSSWWRVYPFPINFRYRSLIAPKDHTVKHENNRNQNVIMRVQPISWTHRNAYLR
jgi:hypothetical protein